MSRRNIIIIVIASLVFIFGIVLLAVAPRFRTPTPSTNDTNGLPVNTNQTPIGGIDTLPPAPTPPPVFTREPSTQSVLLALSYIFAEKYGSFSSDANFQNIEDLKTLMTEDMQVWADTYAAQNADVGGGEFYGVSTRALKAEIISISDDETQAQVAVTTQQEESRGSATANSRIVYKKLLLNFKKIGTEWKVDSANWQ